MSPIVPWSPVVEDTRRLTPAGELPGGEHVFRGTLISRSRYLERESPRSLISLTSKSVGRAIAIQRLRAEASSMSKVIEADFLPRNLEAGSTWLSFIGRPSFNAARRILVVDNDLYTTRLIKLLLEKKGNYFVLPENDPAKAHQAARDFRPDLILLDIVSLEIDGHSFLAKPINISELVGAIEQHLPHARKATSWK